MVPFFFFFVGEFCVTIYTGEIIDYRARINTIFLLWNV